MPLAYNPETKILYSPLTESCMDIIPVAPGTHAFLSAGVRWGLRARPGSDGLYGRVQAINLETKKIVWADRRRAPQTSGVLATAGGIVFAGSYDRKFSAYDDANGKLLWETGLDDVPTGTRWREAIHRHSGGQRQRPCIQLDSARSRNSQSAGPWRGSLGLRAAGKGSAQGARFTLSESK
jgi:glucose dehydrogenase